MTTLVLTSGIASGQANKTIGVVVDSAAANPFSGYLTEVLKTEGFRGTQTESLSGLTLSTLQSYNTIILSETSLTTPQADIFRQYVAGGGSLIAMRPDGKLDDVFGLARNGDQTPDTNDTLGYTKIGSSTPLGAGLETSTTLKIHGVAGRYGTTGSATKVASLYNGATDTGYASVVRSTYGAGQAVAFSYDLAKSTVQLRQGNPAWAGATHAGATAAKFIDLMYDKASSTYWNDQIAKDGVLQADEQMRLLTHSIEATSASKMPLPRLWYFPNAKKSMVAWTMDQDNGSIANINSVLTTVNAHGGHVSVYLLPSPYPTASDVTGWNNSGNRIGVHPNDRVVTSEILAPTWAGMTLRYDTQIADFQSHYPTATLAKTVRNHYVMWDTKTATGANEFAAQAQIEANHGFQLDFNYYWQGIPGEVTWPDASGRTIPSGLPMHFSTSTGQLVNVFQTDTQITDEGWAAPDTGRVNRFKNLIDGSMTGGKYTWVAANFHPDHWNVTSGDVGQMLDYAVAKNVPIWSGEEMNSFLQMRDAASFQDVQWSGSVLSFSANVPVSGTGALTVMVPNVFDGDALKEILLGGLDTSYIVDTIAGSDYALFTIGTGLQSISAVYVPEPATLHLLGCGLLGLLVYAWRKRGKTV